MRNSTQPTNLQKMTMLLPPLHGITSKTPYIAAHWKPTKKCSNKDWYEANIEKIEPFLERKSNAMLKLKIVSNQSNKTEHQRVRNEAQRAARQFPIITPNLQRRYNMPQIQITSEQCMKVSTRLLRNGSRNLPP